MSDSSEKCQNEGDADVAYWISVRACACAWRGGVVLQGSGWPAKVCRRVVVVVVVACRGGVPFFRGSFPGTGTTRMRSPDRDLQNVP